jgi:glycosyltransferase involved in cell wall biosynthesis
MKIAVIGNHLPRQCGIATFTTDCCDAIAAEYRTATLLVVAVNDHRSLYAYPARVRYQIAETDISSYWKAASFLNSNHVDLACLQHEFGIYGGKAGRYVLELLKRLNMPVVTTLHSVLREPDRGQRAVMREIALLSDRLIVMSNHSSRLLQEVFGIPCQKIEIIPHGIPNLPFEEPNVHKASFASQDKSVLLTFGLLSPNKGFETVIHALPHILLKHNDVVYIIAGATHPNLKLREGDRYQIQLETLARQLGVADSVVFHNRFFSSPEMASLVGSADIYITPYCHEAQAVSGTLAYALGAGKAIISTPYWHAAELLNDGRGMLVRFDDPTAIAVAAIRLLENDPARQAMRKRAYSYGRNMVWDRVAHSYMDAFVRTIVNRRQPARLRAPVQGIQRVVTRQIETA